MMANLGRFWLLLLLAYIDCSIIDHCENLGNILDDSKFVIDRNIETNQIDCEEYGYQNCCDKDDLKNKVFGRVINNFDQAQTRQLNSVLQDLYQKIRKLKTLTQKQLQINEARLLNMFEDQYPSVSTSSIIRHSIRNLFRHFQSIFRDKQHLEQPINNNDSQLLIKLRSKSLKLGDYLRKIAIKFFRSIFPPIYVCLIADDCGRRRNFEERSRNLHKNYTECLDEWADSRNDEFSTWYGEENLQNFVEHLIEFLRPVNRTIEKLTNFTKHLTNFKENEDKKCKIGICKPLFCSLVCRNSTKMDKNRICISSLIRNEFEQNCTPKLHDEDETSQEQYEILDDMPDIRPIFRNILQKSVVKNGPAISAAIFDYCGPLYIDENSQTITNSSTSEENHPIKKKSIRRRAENSRFEFVNDKETTIFQVVSDLSQNLDSLRKDWFLKLMNDSIKSLKSLKSVEYTTCIQENEITMKNATARYVSLSTGLPISRITDNQIEERQLTHTQGAHAASSIAIVSTTFQPPSSHEHSTIAQNPQNYIVEYNGGIEGSGSGELSNGFKHRKSLITDDDDYVNQQQNDDEDAFSSGDRPMNENSSDKEEYASGDGQLPKMGGQQSPQDAIIEELLESSSSNDNADDVDVVTATFESISGITPGIYAIQTVYQSSGQISKLRFSIGLSVCNVLLILYRRLI